MKVKGWRDANLRSRGEPHTGHAQAPAPPKVLQGDSQSKSMSTLISQKVLTVPNAVLPLSVMLRLQCGYIFA